MNDYTGRQIAIFTDIHGLLEPLEAILNDIKLQGITEIYSLGDNIGEGPNPLEVIKLLEENGVISIAGNAEEYVRLGIESFPYVNPDDCDWTYNQLGEEGKEIVSKYKRSIELNLGGKKIGLCHFANDIRFNFNAHSTWSYQSHFNLQNGNQIYKDSSEQFKYTNSEEEKDFLNKAITRDGSSPFNRGIISSKEEPLFNGKTIDEFDVIIQGHVHWKLYDENQNTKFYTIRAAGLAYRENPINSASYVILKERTNNQGFDIEERLVTFDREKMVESVLNSTNRDNRIQRFISITEEERLNHKKTRFL